MYNSFFITTVYNAIQAPNKTQMQVLNPKYTPILDPKSPLPLAAELDDPPVPIAPPVPVGAIPLGRLDA